MLGLETPVVSEHDTGSTLHGIWRRFRALSASGQTAQAALYDEFHAHLVGDALPVAIGRFAACKHPRVSEKAYRERRAQSLGQSPAACRARCGRASRASRFQHAGRALFPGARTRVARRRAAACSHASEIDPALLDFDCIAVDECQDLTPIEAWFVVELAALINRRRRTPVPLLLAGDEAQTVRPTDFEWAWLSDLLHARVGTPTEYKLAANMRSPRRIAGLVNRVWDLYSHFQKQERPSGTGYAEIEDDATDQILYCTAAAGPELDELLISLSTREGLALITLEETVPAFVPERGSRRGAHSVRSEGPRLSLRLRARRRTPHRTDTS